MAMTLTDIREADRTGFPLPAVFDELVNDEPTILDEDLVDVDPTMDELLELRGYCL